MTRLPVHFCVLKYAGGWCPEHLSSTKKALYKFYSLVVITLMLCMNICQFAKLLLGRTKDFTEFNNVFNIALTLAVVTFSAIYINVYHNEIMLITRMFEDDYCQARDSVERDLLQSYEIFNRKLATRVLYAIQVPCVLHFSAPITKGGISSRELPYSMLLPYSLLNPVIYGLTYVIHSIYAFITCLYGVIMDMTIVCCLSDLSCQHFILKHRISQFPNYDHTVARKGIPLSDIVEHHVHLYKIAKAITRTFASVFILHFYVDALEISVAILETIKTQDLADKISRLAYILVLLIRIFFTCYFGNEVSQQSESVGEALYRANWTQLAPSQRRDLRLIMIRSTKPIIISTRAFVSLMLKTFVKIVKCSYSAYNLLNTTV